VKIDWPRNGRSPGALDAVAVIGVVGLLVARFVPVAVIIPFWGCSFRRMTGIPCPGCGLTRAADHFAHLHFYQSFAANPLGFIAACLFVVAIVVSVGHLVFGFKVPWVTLDDREWRAVRWALFVVVLINYGFVVLQHLSPVL
jgi:hypothetical protein